MSFHSHCLVVAGPSGVGKSTLIHGALAQNPDWVFSVSATTRARREGETEGREYYFLERADFLERAAAGAFLEYAEVYGNLYGTPAAELKRAQESGKHLLIEVDTVGCLSIRSLRPEIPIAAIVPPGLDELKRRLRDRGTEDEASLSVRFANIYAELQRMRGFDYVITNDEIEPAVQRLLDLMRVVQAGTALVTPAIDALLEQHGGAQ